jgi:glycosidase
VDAHATPADSYSVLNGWFADTLPDMNQQEPAVAQYLTQNMIWWIEKAGIDALRIDTFPFVQRSFWQSYLSELGTLYPHLTEVGEVENADPTIVAFFAGGRNNQGPDGLVDTHLTTPLDYAVYHVLYDVLRGKKPFSELEATLRRDWLYPHPGDLVIFLDNHDQPRLLNDPTASPALLRLATGLLMTLRGTPQLYAGDEIGMRGAGDPDNRRDFPGGFPGDPRNAFTASGRTPAEATMHDWTAALGKLRAESPALQTGRMQTLVAGESTFAFVRMLSPGAGACAAPGSMLVALNRGPTPETLTIPVAATALEGCRVLSSRLGDDPQPSRPIVAPTLALNLPANGFAVYQLQ